MSYRRRLRSTTCRTLSPQCWRTTDRRECHSLAAWPVCPAQWRATLGYWAKSIWSTDRRCTLTRTAVYHLPLRNKDKTSARCPVKLLIVSHYFESHHSGVELVAGRLAQDLAGLNEDIVWVASNATPPPSEGHVR